MDHSKIIDMFDTYQRPAKVAAALLPRSMWALMIRGSHFGTFWNLSRKFRYLTGKFSDFSNTSGNNFPYMNLILRTLPDLLLTSRISSKTPNQYSFIPSIISLQTLATSASRMCRHDPINNL